MKYLIGFLVAVIIIPLLLIAFNAGLIKHERIECEQWAEQARTIQGFYLLEWQCEQCANYGIYIEQCIVK